MSISNKTPIRYKKIFDKIAFAVILMSLEMNIFCLKKTSEAIPNTTIIKNNIPAILAVFLLVPISFPSLFSVFDLVRIQRNKKSI